MRGGEEVGGHFKKKKIFVVVCFICWVCVCVYGGVCASELEGW